MRATIEVMINKKVIKLSDFKQVSELKASDQAQALCDNKIDVMIYTAGHPNGAIQEVTTSCETRLVSVDGPEVDELIKEYPFYAYTVIPGGMYAGNPTDVKTFGVKATFVSMAEVPDDVVYQVVKAVFDNFDNFKTLHPVFSSLNPAKMIKEGNTAPLHNGAIKYYKEKGWM
jgi:TRAP transporter TAXI family solute receptor